MKQYRKTFLKCEKKVFFFFLHILPFLNWLLQSVYEQFLKTNCKFSYLGHEYLSTYFRNNKSISNIETVREKLLKNVKKGCFSTFFTVLKLALTRYV